MNNQEVAKGMKNFKIVAVSSGEDPDSDSGVWAVIVLKTKGYRFRGGSPGS
jgi:hypothetical protein